MKSHLLSLAALSVCAVSTPSSHAQVLVSLDTELPSNIEYSNPAVTTTGTITWYNTVSSAEREIAQSFQPTSSFTMSGLTLLLNDSGSAVGNGTGTGNTNTQGANFTLSFYSSTTNRFDTSSTVTLLSTQSGTLPTTGFTGADARGMYINFDLDENISLTAGTYYAFAFSFPDAATDRAVQFVVNGNTLPGTGYSYTFLNSASSPGSWVASGGNDYAFYLTAVPEPALSSLVGMALGGLLLNRRIRLRRAA